MELYGSGGTVSGGHAYGVCMERVVVGLSGGAQCVGVLGCPPPGQWAGMGAGPWGGPRPWGHARGCSEVPNMQAELGVHPQPLSPIFPQGGGSPVLPREPALTEFGVSGEVLRGSTTEPHFVPSLGLFRARNENRARISVASSSVTLRGDIQGTAAIQGSPKMTKKSGKREIFVPFFFKRGNAEDALTQRNWLESRRSTGGADTLSGCTQTPSPVLGVRWVAALSLDHSVGYRCLSALVAAEICRDAVGTWDRNSCPRPAACARPSSCWVTSLSVFFCRFLEMPLWV